jgi:hypothetical protein
MKKEQVVAIILGSALGVAIAFGIWRMAGRSRTQAPVSPPTDHPQSNAVAVDGLNIVSPANNSVSSSSTVNIAGLTKPNSAIVISGGKTNVGEASKGGEFSIKAELTAGINSIVIWALSKDQKPQKQELTLIHTTKLDVEPEKTAQSLMGTVTDIASDTLQIRTKSGEIEQLSLTDNTTYVQINDETRELTFSDLAIGDFVAALGTRAEEGILVVGRVLITSEPKTPEVTAITGTIKTLTSKDFLVTSDGQEISIDATGTVATYSAGDGGLVSARLSGADAGDAIAIVGSYEEDELVAETIILL